MENKRTARLGGNISCLKEWSVVCSRKSFSKVIIAVIIGLVVAGATVNSYAAAKTDLRPVLQLTTPNTGIAIYDMYPGFVTPGYDHATQTILVSGTITNVERPLIRYEVRINGIYGPTMMKFFKNNTKGARTTSLIFSRRIPLGEYELWPMRGVVAELVDRRNDEVIARDSATFYDLRKAPAATTTGDSSDKFEGWYTQLTDRGLGYKQPNDTLSGMENVHMTSLPQPSLSGFNDTLTESVLQIPRYDDDSNVLRACQDLDKVSEPNFRNVTRFAPYAEAMAEAETILQAYNDGMDTCAALGYPPAVIACEILLQSTCVKLPPTASDFELCVDQIEGKAQSARMDEVSDIGLSFISSTNGTSADLKSHVTIDGFHGKVNGYLREIFVRWKHDCAGKPRANLDDDEITSTPWIDTWATCLNMSIDSEQVSTVPTDEPAYFSISTDISTSASGETLKASLISPGNFSYINNSRNPDKGTCAASFINSAADDMLETFVDNLRRKFELAWSGNSNYSQQADSLTKVMSTYNLGLIEYSDMYITAPFAAIYSDYLSGMKTSWFTDVVATVPDAIMNRKPNYFYYSAAPAAYSVDAKDMQGNFFDMSYGITTGFLNRVLNIKAADGTLDFNFRPTWSELSSFGVATPANAAPEDEAILNEATLKQFDPAFNGIDSGEIEILVQRSPFFDPFVYMPRDVNFNNWIPNVGLPTTYGIPSLEVIFKYIDTIDPITGLLVQGEELIKADVSFTDTQFKFIVDQTPEVQFLLPNMSNDNWGAGVVKSSLPNCPMYYAAAPYGNCEDLLEENIADLMKIRLHDTLENYLTRIPIPEYFSAAGEAATPVHFDPQSRYQEGQYITFYGQLKE